MAAELRQRRRTATSTGESTGTDDLLQPRGVVGQGGSGTATAEDDDHDAIAFSSPPRSTATRPADNDNNDRAGDDLPETETPPPRFPPSRLLFLPQDPEIPSSASSLLSTTSSTPHHLHPQTHRRRDGTSSSSESKWTKISRRGLSGFLMLAVFATSVLAGHIYICLKVALIETLLFRELVRVRYNAYFARIHGTIPLFRTTQWLWFAVAIFYTYGDFVSDVVQSNQTLHYLLKYTQYWPSVSFFLYSSTFVLSIITLQRDHIRFQMNQLCWTILVLCLTVGQLKYVMHNIFNGLFWYVLPCSLVFVNDIMAYVAGVTCGRKFIQREFILVSPNKTWEGFIGGGIFTIIAAWHLAGYLAQFSWMTCPVNEFRLAPDALQCEPHPIFMPAQAQIPSQIFDLFPAAVVKSFFPIVEICTNSTNNNALLRCVSGDHDLVHHHFELYMTNYYPVQMHALWLGLFASLVAPFGGFLASAIKRAYGIKDFDSIIPGHGGVMDRMDCQFLMALYTWVHFNSFVKFSNVSVPKLVYLYSMLSESEQAEFLEVIRNVEPSQSYFS